MSNAYVVTTGASGDECEAALQTEQGKFFETEEIANVWAKSRLLTHATHAKVYKVSELSLYRRRGR